MAKLHTCDIPREAKSQGMKRVCFVQHAGSLGGSAVSLRYTIQGLKALGYRIKVVLVRPSRTLEAFYLEAGAEVEHASWMPLFEHTTAGWAHPLKPIRLGIQLRSIFVHLLAGHNYRAFAESHRDWIIHLNSSVLALVARGLSRWGSRLVWHIRESPIHGLLGFRKRLLEREMRRTPSKCIFISEYDREQWIPGERRAKVIKNFVPKEFTEIHKAPYLGTLRILYLGGSANIKGPKVLLRALSIIKKEKIKFYCTMPGAKTLPPASRRGRVIRPLANLLGIKTESQKLWTDIQIRGLREDIAMIDFTVNVMGLLENTDVVVFPSTAPHFARPVVEAAASAVPSIGSRIGGVEELIDEGITGLLFEPGNSAELAERLALLARRRDLLKAMGEKAKEKALSEFDLNLQCKKIDELYTECR